MKTNRRKIDLDTVGISREMKSPAREAHFWSRSLWGDSETETTALPTLRGRWQQLKSFSRACSTRLSGNSIGIPRNLEDRPRGNATRGELTGIAFGIGCGATRTKTAEDTKDAYILVWHREGHTPPRCVILTHRVTHRQRGTSTSMGSGQRFRPFGRKTRPSSASSFTWLLLGQFGLSATRPLSHLS